MDPADSGRLRTKAEISQHLRNILLQRHNTRKRTASEDNQNNSTTPVKRHKSKEDENEDKERYGAGDSSPTARSPITTPGLSEEENEVESEDDASDRNENETEAHAHPIYTKGTQVFENDLYKVFVKGVAHKRRTRYSLSDHLFTMWVEPKSTNIPLIFDLEFALEKALTYVLDRLKTVYDSRHNQNQIYITVAEKNILHGLNSGNYSLHTPSSKIVRWVLSMLYNYLKSEQTLRLNDSFKIQIKVLSHRHVKDLEQRRTNFRRHIYH